MTTDEDKSLQAEIDFNYLLDCAELVSYSTKVPNEIRELCNRRANLTNFNLIRGIAKGGYGSVYLVQSNSTKNYYALKVIKKQVVMDLPHLALFKNEKAALKSARNSKHLVSMYCSFQNEHSIFFLMDFFPTELLDRIPLKNEKELRFYAANVLLAIEELHRLGYVHRDIKPENIFMDRSGYLKLADFGSCCYIKDLDRTRNTNYEFMNNKYNRKLTNSSICSTSSSLGSKSKSEVMVGTPDYIAPECFKNEQGTEVDLWAFGIVLYELKNDIPPFYADTLLETQNKIRNIDYSKESGTFGDLIDNLLQPKENRFDIQKCKEHAFLKDIDFENFFSAHIPEFVPQINTEQEPVNIETEEIEQTCKFVGFGYDPEFDKFGVNLPKKIIRSHDDLKCLDSDGLIQNVNSGRCSSEATQSIEQASRIDSEKVCFELTEENKDLKDKLMLFTNSFSHLKAKAFEFDSLNKKVAGITANFARVDLMSEEYKKLQKENKRLSRFKKELEELKATTENATDLIRSRKIKEENGLSQEKFKKSFLVLNSPSKRKMEEEKVYRNREDLIKNGPDELGEESLAKKLPKSEFKENIFIKSVKVIELEGKVEMLLKRNEMMREQIEEINQEKEKKELKMKKMKENITNFNYFTHTIINNMKITLGEVDIAAFFSKRRDEIRTLKKLLKVKEQEKKEIEMKNNSEVEIRKRLEKEILKYKAEIKRYRAKGEINIAFKVKVDGQKTTLRIEKSQLYLFDIVENLSNCVSANLSKAEKMKFKRVSVVKLVFIEESASSVIYKKPKLQIL